MELYNTLIDATQSAIIIFLLFQNLSLRKKNLALFNLVEMVAQTNKAILEHFSIEINKLKNHENKRASL